jgi:16S rRNA (guanine(966)-N(2))-methyltransferase RsmD
VRIVAGALRGHRLRAPAGPQTRPTSDRVRESLFQILGPLDGLAVLDLFAGSGALGLEALSRGAATATLIDDAGAAIAAIHGNLETLRVEAEVRRMDAVRFLERAAARGRQYDLVFLDPPYRRAQALAPRLSAALPGVLSTRARVVAETDQHGRLELGFDLIDERRYGQTMIQIFHAPA